MQIIITSISGQLSLFEVNPYDTVESLKLKISDRMGISPDNQQLTFGEKVLDNPNDKLCRLNVNNLSKIRLDFVCEIGMKIHVQTMCGIKFVVKQCNPSDTVRELKEKVVEMGGGRVELQRFIFKGRLLEDERTLDSYGLKDGSTVDSIPRISLN